MDRGLRAFSEGIDLVLKRWWALQTAVENELGGRDSRLKAHQLANNVLSWFTQSREPLNVDDLEGILDEGMLTSLNVEVEDGSIIQVARHLMDMHEDCLNGNFRSIEMLREAYLKQAAHPRVTQVINDDEDEDSDNDEDIIGVTGDNSSNMDVDIPNFESDMNSVNKPANEPLAEVAAEADDGWVAVSSRRNKGRKN